MDKNTKNRMAESERTRVVQPPAQEAIPDMTQRKVPPLVCPICQRGMTPRVTGWRADGKADCTCGANGCRFTYLPAQVQPTASQPTLPPRP